jgi:hypothetical protein
MTDEQILKLFDDVVPFCYVFNQPTVLRFARALLATAQDPTDAASGTCLKVKP